MYRPVNLNVNEAPALVDHVDVSSKSDTLPPRVHPGLCEYTMRALRSSNTVTLITCVEGGRAMMVERICQFARCRQFNQKVTPFPSSHTL